MLKALLTFRHWYKVPAGEYNCNEGPILTRLRRDFNWEILTDASWENNDINPVKHRVIGLSLDKKMAKDSFNIFYSYSALTERITFYWVQYIEGVCYSWEIKSVCVGGKVSVKLQWDCDLKTHKVFIDSECAQSIMIADRYRWGWRLTPLLFKTSAKMWEVKINKKIFS
jgi:hypothetical protein